MLVCVGIHWRTTQVDWTRVLMFSVSFLKIKKNFFFSIVSGFQTRGLVELTVSLWDTLLSWAFLPTNWSFLWHSAVLGLTLCSLSTVSYQVLTQRMEFCLDAWCLHRILHFLWRFQLNHRCTCVSRTPLDSACQSLPEPEPSELLHSDFLSMWCQGWLSWSQLAGFLVASCLGLSFHRSVHQL